MDYSCGATVPGIFYLWQNSSHQGLPFFKNQPGVDSACVYGKDFDMNAEIRNAGDDLGGEQLSNQRPVPTPTRRSWVAVTETKDPQEGGPGIFS